MKPDRVEPGQVWTLDGPTSDPLFGPRTFEVKANHGGTVFLREITVGPILEGTMLRSERWQLVDGREEEL